jgi:hypothetical protein
VLNSGFLLRSPQQQRGASTNREVFFISGFASTNPETLGRARHAVPLQGPGVVRDGKWNRRSGVAHVRQEQQRGELAVEGKYRRISFAMPMNIG